MHNKIIYNLKKTNLIKENLRKKKIIRKLLLIIKLKKKTDNIH